jgi:hypothetical protein
LACRLTLMTARTLPSMAFTLPFDGRISSLGPYFADFVRKSHSIR